jgi:hypothetical protein
MQEQNLNTEKVDFRFVATDKPNSPRISAAKWLRSHKTEVLDFLTKAIKHEIISDNEATPAQIYWAKVESAAFHRYMAESLSAQIAVERGEFPTVDVVASQVQPFATNEENGKRSPQLSSLDPQEVQPSLPPEDDDNDEDWDDDTLDPPQKSEESKSASKANKTEDPTDLL